MTPEAAKIKGDRQCEWAYQRTALAFERTYTAWIRTGLAALAFGIGLRTVAPDVQPWLLRLSESALIAFSAFCFVAGLWRAQEVGLADRPERPLSLPVLAGMSGLLLMGAAAALAGIWLA